MNENENSRDDLVSYIQERLDETKYFFMDEMENDYEYAFDHLWDTLEKVQEELLKGIG